MPKEIKYYNEADVKKQVKKLLDKHKWFWWMPPANGYGRAGLSDIQALRDGVFLAVETKFGKNVPTQMQAGFLLSVQAESGFGFVVNESRIQWLEAWLSAFDRSVEATRNREQPLPEDGALMINAMREMTQEL